MFEKIIKQLDNEIKVIQNEFLKFKQKEILHKTKNAIIENQVCPKCKEKGSLKYKSYLMFSRVCKNDGTYVKLPTHPNYGD